MVEDINNIQPPAGFVIEEPSSNGNGLSATKKDPLSYTESNTQPQAPAAKQQNVPVESIQPPEGFTLVDNATPVVKKKEEGVQGIAPIQQVSPPQKEEWETEKAYSGLVSAPFTLKSGGERRPASTTKYDLSKLYDFSKEPIGGYKDVATPSKMEGVEPFKAFDIVFKDESKKRKDIAYAVNTGDIPLAKSKIELAMNEEPNNYQLQKMYSYVVKEDAIGRAARGDFNGALNSLDDAISKDIKNTDLYVWRAYAGAKSGNKEGALNDANSVIALRENELRSMKDFSQVEDMNEKFALRDTEVKAYNDLSYMYQVKAALAGDSKDSKLMSEYLKLSKDYETKAKLTKDRFYRENAGYYQEGFTDYLVRSPFMPLTAIPTGMKEGIETGVKGISDEFSDTRTSWVEKQPGVYEKVVQQKEYADVPVWQRVALGPIGLMNIEKGDNYFAKTLRIASDIGKIGFAMAPPVQQFNFALNGLKLATGDKLGPVEEAVFAPVSTFAPELLKGTKLGDYLTNTKTGASIMELGDIVAGAFLMGKMHKAIPERPVGVKLPANLEAKFSIIEGKIRDGIELKEGDRLTPEESNQLWELTKGKENISGITYKRLPDKLIQKIDKLQGKIEKGEKVYEYEKLTEEENKLVNETFSDNIRNPNIQEIIIAEMENRRAARAVIDEKIVKERGVSGKPEDTQAFIPRDVEEVVGAIRDKEMVDARKAAMTKEYLENEMLELEREKDNPDREHTIPEIENMQSQIKEMFNAIDEFKKQWEEPKDAKTDGRSIESEGKGLIEEGKIETEQGREFAGSEEQVRLRNPEENGVVAAEGTEVKQPVEPVKPVEDVITEPVKPVENVVTEPVKPADKTVAAEKPMEKPPIEITETKGEAKPSFAEKREKIREEYIAAKEKEKESGITRMGSAITDADIVYYAKIAMTYLEEGFYTMQEVIRKVRGFAKEDGVNLSYTDAFNIANYKEPGGKSISEIINEKIENPTKAQKKAEREAGHYTDFEGFDKQYKEFKKALKHDELVATTAKKAVEKEMKREMKNAEKARKEWGSIREQKIKDEYKRINRERVENDTRLSEGIKEILESNELKGKLTERQTKSIINHARRVKTENQLAKFEQRIKKIFEDANYEEKLERAEKLRKQIRRKKSPNSAIIEFSQIDPSDVNSIDQYISVAEKVKSAAEGVKVRRVGGVEKIINEELSISDKEIQDYNKIGIEENRSAQQKRLEAADIKRADKVQELIDNITDSEKAVESDKAIESLMDDEPQLNSALDDLVETKKIEMVDFIESNSGEKMSDGTTTKGLFSDEQTKQLKDAVSADDRVLPTAKDKIEFVNAINTAIKNGRIEPIEKFADRARRLEMLDADIGYLESIGKTKPGEIIKEFRSLNQKLEHLGLGPKAAATIRRITGIGDVGRAYVEGQKYRNELIKKYVELQEKLNTKENRRVYGDLRNEKNNIERTIISILIETIRGATKEQINEAFKYKVEEYVGKDIRNKMDSQIKSERNIGAVAKEIFDRLTKDVKTYDEFIKKVEDNPNYELVKYFTEEYRKMEPEYQRMVARQQKPLEVLFDEHTANRLINTKDQKFGRDITKDEAPISSSIMGGPLSSEKAATRKLPPGRSIDYSFDQIQTNDLYQQMFKSKSLQARQFLEYMRKTGMIDDAIFGKGEKGVENRNMFFESAVDMINMATGNVHIEKGISDYAQRLISATKSLAYNMVLLGLPSLIKQYTPLAGTLSNMAANGRVDIFVNAMRMYGNEGAKKIMDSEPIGLRGTTKAGYDVRREVRKLAKGFENSNNMKDVLKNLDKSIQYVRNGTLIWPDMYSAKTSWLAYYIQDQVSRGKKMDDIMRDLDNGVKDAEAAEFANVKTDKTQGVSSAIEAQKIYTNPNVITQILLPFSSFSVNYRMRLHENINNLLRGKEKKEASQDIVSAIIDQATFETAKYFLVGKGIQLAADGVMEQLGITPEEDKSKVVIGGKEYNKKDIQYIDNIFNGIFFSGLGTPGESLGKEIGNVAYNYLVEKEYDFRGKEDKDATLWNYNANIQNPDNPFDKVLGYLQWAGAYAAIPLQQASRIWKDVAMLSDGTIEYKTSSGNVIRKKIPDNIRKSLQLQLFLDVLNMTGRGESGSKMLADKLNAQRNKIIKAQKKTWEGEGGNKNTLKEKYGIDLPDMKDIDIPKIDKIDFPK